MQMERLRKIIKKLQTSQIMITMMTMTVMK